MPPVYRNGVRLQFALFGRSQRDCQMQSGVGIACLEEAIFVSYYVTYELPLCDGTALAVGVSA
jgi:hypothetical protein